MSAEELRKEADDIKAGKDVSVEDVEVSQSTEFAETKKEVQEPEADYSKPEPDVKLGTSETDENKEVEFEAPKTEEDTSEAETETPQEEEPQIEVPAEDKIIKFQAPDSSVIPSFDQLNANLSSESPSIDLTPSYEPSLNANNITLESPTDIDPNSVSTSTTDFSYDMPMDGGYSFGNEETTQPLADVNDGQYQQYEEINKDIKYFKDPNVIPRLMDIIKENISVGVKELIEKEFKRLQEPMMNTSEVGERSYNLADRMIRKGQNLDSFNEYERITEIRENGKDASNDFTNNEASPLQSFDEFGYIAKNPVNMSYIQQNDSNMNVAQDYEPGQSIIKGNFGYGEDQDQSNNLKKVG